MLAQYLVSIENNNGCTPRNQGEEIHGTELAEYSRHLISKVEGKSRQLLSP